MIVKIQLPVMSNEDAALVYNEDRSVFFQAPAEEFAALFKPGELKAFFHAELEDTILHVGERAKWQSW